MLGIFAYLGRSKIDSPKMDLWVKDMPVEEMKNFIFQTFMSMKNTLQKSTSDQNLTNLVDDFCKEFKRIIDIDKV